MNTFPIQSSDTGSNGDWFEHGKNGMLANPEDVEAFAECLRVALTDGDLVDNAGNQD